MWKDVYLAVFTVFIDDSGTDPSQRIAIASGLIFPDKQLPKMDREWVAFMQREGITDFHSSECVARNRHSSFAQWDDERIGRVLARVRQIIRKYSVNDLALRMRIP
jgi:hypothetical protein